jgi:hypothetical protein
MKALPQAASDIVPIMSTSILGCDAHKRHSVFVELREDEKAHG